MAATHEVNVRGLRILFVSLLSIISLNNVAAMPMPFIETFQTVNLHEDNVAQTTLALINCTDIQNANGQECGTCNLVEITNDGNLFFTGNLVNNNLFNNGPFDVFRISNTFLTNSNRFFIVYVPNQGQNLDYSIIRTYRIVVQCLANDGITVSPSQTLEVDIIPNQAPVVAGLPGVTVTLDARNGPVGSLVFDVQVTDNETDPISYVLTVDPSTVDLFQISQQDGIISVIKDLRTATVTPVTLRVNVSDGNHVVGPLTITVNLINMNSRPTVQNLPLNITLNEDAPAGTLIATLTISDPDIFQTIAPVFNVNPISEASKFIFNSGTNQVRLNTVATGATLLDAESVNSVNLSFSLFDGFLPSVNAFISLTIASVNEPPFFSRPVHFCTLLEGNQFGSTCNLGLTIRDPEGDIILSPFLNPANNSNLFSLENDNLRITNNYVVDGGAFPASTTLTIEVADDQGATGSALIQVNVLDQNTQTPDFGGSATSVVITQNVLTPPTTLATITATDADLTSPNNDVTLRLQSSVNLGSNVIFTNDGRITYLNRFAANKDCSDCRLEIIAFDGGSPARTATTTYYVSFVTTTTTPSTTTSTTTTTTTTTTTAAAVISSSNAFSTPAGAAVLGILIALLVLLLLLVVGYFLYRYCTYGTCCGPTGPNGSGGIGGAGGGGGGMCGNCCGGPQDQPNQVRPRPEGPDYGQLRTPPPQDGFRNNSYKASGDYRDDFWNNNDGYIDNRPRSIKSVRIGGFSPSGNQRALPSNRPY